MNIKEILERLSLIHGKRYKRGDNDALYIAEAERYIKNIIWKICNKYNVIIYKNRIQFRQGGGRRGGNVYGKTLLCRIFGNEEKNVSLFHIMIYFNVVDEKTGSKNLRAGIKIDRYTKRMGIETNSKEDKQCVTQLNNEVNKIAKELGYHIDNKEFSFNEKDATDSKFIKYIENRIGVLNSIYRKLVKEDFTFTNSCLIKARIYPKLKLKDFKIIDLTHLSPNKEEKPSKKNNKKIPPVDPQKMAAKELENAEVGKQGEELAKEELERMKKNNEIISYKLVSGNAGDDGCDALGYDFEFIDKKHNLCYLEVKTSAKDRIFISKNELDTLKKNIDKYFVWIVDLKRTAIYKTRGKIIGPLFRPCTYKYIFNPNGLKD